MPREQYERTKGDYDISAATLNAAKARLDQAQAQAAQTLKQRDSTAIRIAQQRASLTRAKDQYSKTTIRSTLDGIITYLPVNEGEIAIVGVQNSLEPQKIDALEPGNLLNLAVHEGTIVAPGSIKQLVAFYTNCETLGDVLVVDQAVAKIDNARTSGA